MAQELPPPSMAELAAIGPPDAAVSDHIGGENRGELPGLGHEVLSPRQRAQWRVHACRNVGRISRLKMEVCDLFQILPDGGFSNTE